MDMNEATAKAIGAERSISGMTVKELSAKADIPERSLMRVLQAEREIKVNQIAKIADALGLYPHEIMETAENILERESRPPLRLIPKGSYSDEDLEAMGVAAKTAPEDPDDELDGNTHI